MKFSNVIGGVNKLWKRTPQFDQTPECGHSDLANAKPKMIHTPSPINDFRTVPY